MSFYTTINRVTRLAHKIAQGWRRLLSRFGLCKPCWLDTVDPQDLRDAISMATYTGERPDPMYSEVWADNLTSEIPEISEAWLSLISEPKAKT